VGSNLGRSSSSEEVASVAAPKQGPVWDAVTVDVGGRHIDRQPPSQGAVADCVGSRAHAARNTGTVCIARDEMHEPADEQVESCAIATLSSSACAPSSSPGRMRVKVDHAATLSAARRSDRRVALKTPRAGMESGPQALSSVRRDQRSVKLLALVLAEVHVVLVATSLARPILVAEDGVLVVSLRDLGV
jgi:hypothetical protein